jgi:hypothetical protein
VLAFFNHLKSGVSRFESHNGYLFEITTYPNLGPWLTQIIDTIRF